MPRLLDCMPFPAGDGIIVVRGESIRIRANQIIVWISLTPVRAAASKRPAIPVPGDP